jgi:hypothetical protein
VAVKPDVNPIASTAVVADVGETSCKSMPPLENVQAYVYVPLPPLAVANKLPRLCENDRLLDDNDVGDTDTNTAVERVMDTAHVAVCVWPKASVTTHCATMLLVCPSASPEAEKVVDAAVGLVIVIPDPDVTDQA